MEDIECNPDSNQAFDQISFFPYEENVGRISPSRVTFLKSLIRIKLKDVLCENQMESNILICKDSKKAVQFLILDPHLSICQVYCAKLKRWSHFRMIKDRKV